MATMELEQVWYVTTPLQVRCNNCLQSTTQYKL